MSHAQSSLASSDLAAFSESDKKELGPELLDLYLTGAHFEPLLTLTGSPWIQVVVGKDLDRETSERERSRLADFASAVL